MELIKERRSILKLLFSRINSTETQVDDDLDDPGDLIFMCKVKSVKWVLVKVHSQSKVSGDKLQKIAYLNNKASNG